jgi:hypothetical protein
MSCQRVFRKSTGKIVITASINITSAKKGTQHTAQQTANQSTMEGNVSRLNRIPVIRYLALRVTPIFANKNHTLNTQKWLLS